MEPEAPCDNGLQLPEWFMAIEISLQPAFVAHYLLLLAIFILQFKLAVL